VKHGSFVANITTGPQDVPVSGIGTGKMAMFWGGLNTANDSLDNDHVYHQSLVKDSTQREAFSYFKGNNASPENCICDHAQAAIRAMSDAAGTVFCTADSFTFTSTGFQINWTTAPATAIIINYVIWEATDIANVDIHTLNLAITATTTPKTGLTFNPNALLIMGRPNSGTARGTSSTTGGQAGIMFGWTLGIAGADSTCYADALVDNTAGGTNNSVRRYERVDKSVNLHQSGALTQEATLQSFDTGGYTFISTTGASATRMIVVAAIEKAAGSVWGDIVATEPATAIPLDCTGFGFNPNFVISHGGFHTANNTIQVADNDRMLTSADAGGSRSYFGASRQGTVPRTGARLVTPDFIRHYSSANVLIAQATFSQFITDGVRLNFASVTGTTRRILMLGIKSATRSLVAQSRPHSYRQLTRWHS
jgi:hypothetical protein